MLLRITEQVIPISNQCVLLYTIFENVTLMTKNSILLKKNFEIVQTMKLRKIHRPTFTKDEIAIVHKYNLTKLVFQNVRNEKGMKVADLCYKVFSFAKLKTSSIFNSHRIEVFGALNRFAQFK